MNKLDDRPWSTLLLMAMASSTSLHFRVYRIGAKHSFITTESVGFKPVMIVGSTKKPGPSRTY